MRRPAPLLAALLALSGAVLPAAASAQSPAQPPHAYLFGTWTGGLFPVPANLSSQACLSQPVVIFTRDLVLRATLTEQFLTQREIETARANASGTDFRFAATGVPAEGTRARVERAALDLFTLRGFEQVTTDEVADAAGISRRTFFRYFATKADAVWGDFAAHAARLEELLAGADPAQPVLASVCAAYVEVNDYAAAELPLLRERMQLILRTPELQAHSVLRYAEWRAVIADFVARRAGVARHALLPEVVSQVSLALALSCCVSS